MKKDILGLAEQIQKYALKHNQLSFMKPLNDKLDELVGEIKQIQNNNCNNCKNFKQIHRSYPKKQCTILNCEDIEGCGIYWENINS